MKTTKSIKEIHDEEQWEAFLAQMEALNKQFLQHLSPWERFKARCSDFFWSALEFGTIVYFDLFP